jgi:hypothetical protein
MHKRLRKAQRDLKSCSRRKSNRIWVAFESWLCFLVFLSFSSCSGYHFRSSSSKDTVSFNMREIIQDSRGELTEQIIQAISKDSCWKWDPKNPRFIVSCNILELSHEPLGYRYDRFEPTAQVINRLIPIEARKKLKVEISIEDLQSNQTSGPFYLEGFADYDFVNFDTYKDLAFTDLQGQTQSSLSYSLGQLDASQGAEEAAILRCCEEIGSKISDLLQNY